jgi:catechol 2,3-dioxygenase-like lactoylglutathione lyase family enzyme
MEALGFSHIALTVNDWDRSKPFWERLLSTLGAAKVIDVVGAPHRRADGHMMMYASKTFAMTIWEAFTELRDNHFQLYNVGLHHLAFAAPSRAAVDALYDKLVNEGVAILDPPKDYPYFKTYYAVFFTDPDGIKLEYAFVQT